MTEQQYIDSADKDREALREWAEMAANLPIGQLVLRVLEQRPSVPTREQIAEVLWHVGKDTHDHRLWNRVKDMPDAEFTQHCWQNADAVLALLNGADR